MPFSFVLLFRQALVKQKWETAYLANAAALLLCTPPVSRLQSRSLSGMLSADPVQAQSSGKNIVK